MKIRNKTLIRRLFLFCAILGLGLIQTASIWNFTGEKVDESALFHFSIGFLGGDLNPYWTGYGSVGKYLLSLIYFLLFIPLYLIGKFDSLEEYAMQMYYNGYFVLTARYVFTILSLIAVLFYTRLAKSYKVPLPLILLFVLLAVFSADAIHFANYLRTDVLVGLFSSVAIYLAAQSENKTYLYLLSAAVAAAICSKISALPLILLPFGYTLYHLVKKDISWKHAAISLLIFLLCMVMFQPYTNWISKIIGIINFGIEGRGGGEAATGFNWGKTYHYSIFDRLIEIYSIVSEYVSNIVLACTILIIFARKYLKVLIPSVAVLLLLVLPYINSKEITYYWFVPIFNIIRFIAVLALAGFYFWLLAIFAKNKNKLKIFQYSFFAITIIIFSFSIKEGVSSLYKEYTLPESNKQIATKWIESHLLETENIILDWTVQHYIPTLYNPNDVNTSKEISLSFIYKRHKNEFLNKTFERYLSEQYLSQISINDVKQVTFLRPIANYTKKTVAHNYIGSYYITSPASYQRYLERSSKDLSVDRAQELEYHIEFYTYMFTNPRIKTIDEGAGPPIEIYKIQKKFEIHEKDFMSMTFRNKFATLPDLDLSDNMTIDMEIKLYEYPARWTNLVCSKENDKVNEFCFRIKNDKYAQWYFGDGENIFQSVLEPSKYLPLHKWFRLTVVKDISKNKLVVYINGNPVVMEKFDILKPSVDLESPIYLFGNKISQLQGKLKSIKIYNSALNTDELSNNESSRKHIVGVWEFGGNAKEIDSKIKNNIQKKLEIHELRPVSMKFWNKFATLPDLDLSDNITIDMEIKLYEYPTRWTNLICSKENDKVNEFCFRIKNDKYAQWYFGDGENIFLSKLEPGKYLPLRKWFRLTVVKDISKNKLVVYINGNPVVMEKFDILKPSVDLESPIYLFGNEISQLQGEIQSIKIYKSALNTDELSNNESSREHIVGVWEFRGNAKAIDNKIKNNQQIEVYNID
jgi:hypothetical protein